MENKNRAPLDRIVFISIPEETAQKVKGFSLDTSKLLPVELPPGEDDWSIQDLSWEKIIAAMLKLFAWQSDHPDIDYYRSLIRALEPDIEYTMTQTGILKAKNKDFTIAEEIFRAMVHYNSDNVNNYINLALVYEEQSDLYQKLENFELSEKYISTAFQTYQEALLKHTSSPDLYFNFGNFYIKRGNSEKARQIFQKFITLEPQGKRKDFAIQIVQKIPEYSGEKIILLEAFDLIRMEQEDKAIEKLQYFLTQHSDVWNAWFLLGWAYRKKAEYNRAKEALLQSIAYEHTHIDSYIELAVCLMELQEFALCKQYLQKALRLDGENTKVILNFGILALKEDNREEAAGFFKTVLEYDPENTLAQKYLTLNV